MKKIIIVMLVSFIFLSFVGVVRGELLSSNFSLSSLLNSLASKGFALDTAYSAYFTSETFIYVLNQLPDVKVQELFLDFIKSIFLGEGRYQDSILPIYTHNYIFHQFGGILPFYFYFYLGRLGLFIAAGVVAFYLNLTKRLSSSSPDYFKLLVVWFVCITFRWYLYSPLGLFRGAMLLLFVNYVFQYVAKISNSLRHKATPHINSNKTY